MKNVIKIKNLLIKKDDIKFTALNSKLFNKIAPVINSAFNELNSWRAEHIKDELESIYFHYYEIKIAESLLRAKSTLLEEQARAKIRTLYKKEKKGGESNG